MTTSRGCGYSGDHGSGLRHMALALVVVAAMAAAIMAVYPTSRVGAPAATLASHVELPAMALSSPPFRSEHLQPPF
jgi:hypothetical protein